MTRSRIAIGFVVLVCLSCFVAAFRSARASVFSVPVTASGGYTGPRHVTSTIVLNAQYFAPAVIAVPSTAANDTIVVGVLGTNGGGGGPVATVTDNAASGGNTYTAAVAVTDASNSGPAQFLSLWYVTQAKTTSQLTITFTGGATFGSSIAISEYAGVTTFDSTANAHDTSGGSVNVDSGGLVTAHAGELVVGFASAFRPTMTLDRFSWRYAEAADGLLEDKVVGAAGTYHATATASAAGWIIGAVSFF